MLSRASLWRCLFLCLVSIPGSACLQQPSNLPTFFPVIEHSYGIREGLPDLSIQEVLIDKHGHMHIYPDGASAFGQYFHEFDGEQTYPSKFKTIHTPYNIDIGGIDPFERLFGIYAYEKEKGKPQGQVVFIFDPITGITHNYEKDAITDGWIWGLNAVGDAFYTLISSDSLKHFKVLRIDSSGINTVTQFAIEQPLINFGRLLDFCVTDNAIWLACNSKQVFRIDRSSNAVQSYEFPGVISAFWRVFEAPNHDVWFPSHRLSNLQKNVKEVRSIYVWDHNTGKILRNPYKPNNWKDSDIKSAFATKDFNGNVLVGYWNWAGIPSATLLDNLGQLYDYSSITSDQVYISGSDFKQCVIFHFPGLRFVEVSTRNAIKCNQQVGQMRGLAELNPQTIRLNNPFLLTNDTGKWVLKPDALTCIGSMGDGDMVSDKKGHIWYTEGVGRNKNVTINLMRYQPEQARCDTFHLGFSVERFGFMDDGQMVLVGKGFQVYIWNPEKGPARLLTKHVFPEQPNQVLSSKDGTVWVATKKGLLKIDQQTGRQQWIEMMGTQVFPILRILEDAKGRLWLGTTLKGIIIYDPVSGETQVIDKTNGLSNNTVVSLLQDNDGDIWAGTFFGITILSPEGGVMGKLYEEDGLANYECNRWSAMKMRDGRLCFGSQGGVTIIDPALWKSPKEGYRRPVIYLTALYSAAKGDALTEEDHLPAFAQKQQIVLPANNRNLIVSFALSNYASPERSIFAYQVEGVDKDWRFIGSQHKLYLNALPAGSYNILIKGSDGKGEWSDPPIVIPILVQEFFYKQWWFICLSALPFIAFFMVAVLYRQRNKVRKEKQRSDALLLNILPLEVAEELKQTGGAMAKQFNHVSVLFTDFVNFTGISEELGPVELVAEIHRNFSAFDAIIEKNGLEKIKTIGDAYMAVCGLPVELDDHALRTVRAAVEIRDYVDRNGGQFKVRIGINSGPVIAGIVGLKKYAYDIWGDTVNTANRMEANSVAGKINISGSTFEMVKEQYTCVYRGKVKAKGKGAVDMYFVE